ncbi:hypothetical protein [Enterovibrio norvegicus]|uniref:Uncharacterized protein n=2 Tax=Enterovibrio norvegicus TaxID=188144 RepID=A0A1I5JTC4_9GAMM|nr:hypothetical protein [Enterovibrio norvegicus]OEF58412.1 hypothetical protein A1OU_09510 [Enterovibrio norvegicus]SFO75989.1 hypothetical protein SAMN03084138_00327 [Enterovibrio norvegicus DSM 15893]
MNDFSERLAGIWAALGSFFRQVVIFFERIINAIFPPEEIPDSPILIQEPPSLRDSTLDLESIGNSSQEATAAWKADKARVRVIAKENQLKIEQALGTRDELGNLVPDTKLSLTFNVVLGRGYFPILGDLIIPVGSGFFRGQGSYVRRKSLSVALRGVAKHPTALCPIGGSDNNGLLTQCGSTFLTDFAVSGCLKDKGDGGNGIVLGHTPPQPSVSASTQPNTPQFWAGQPNRLPQKRFTFPLVWTGLTSFRLNNGKGDSEITVPARGAYNTPKDVLLDDKVDIPLVRWVRAFASNGKEVARYANVGSKLAGGIVGINADDRQTTGKPKASGETRVYHKPIGENDTKTTVVVPSGLPENTAKVEVSFYNLVTHYSLVSQMTPYLPGNYYTTARASYNEFMNIVVERMPWNGFVGIDGAYNTLTNLMARENGLDGWFFPGGYEDYMHNAFVSCAAVNNGGWSLYASEPVLASRNVKDTKGWPNAAGVLKVHQKFTYTASSNDFGNFDTYGSRGGSIYMGASSNSMQTGSMEDHFDSNNVDPFGNSPEKAESDWNPLRWTSLVVFAADARQNDMVVTSTPTDSRRVTYCKTRLTQETPATNNPNSNVYSAISTNHYCHPRPDSYGSLVEVRPPSIAHLHLTSYDEHERDAGDVQSIPGGVGEIQGLFSGLRSYLFRPWFYGITPLANQQSLSWKVAFSARHTKLAGNAKEVSLSADALGIAGQHKINNLYFGTIVQNFKGRRIAAGGVYTISTMVDFFERKEFDDIDMNLLNVSANYLDDEIEKTVGTPAPTLPTSLLMMSPRVRLWKNAAGDKKFSVEIPMLNTDDKDLVYPDTANLMHYFKIKIETASADTSLQ